MDGSLCMARIIIMRRWLYLADKIAHSSIHNWARCRLQHAEAIAIHTIWSRVAVLLAFRVLLFSSDSAAYTLSPISDNSILGGRNESHRLAGWGEKMMLMC